MLLKADGSRVPILKSVMPLVRQGRTYLVEAFGDLTDQKRTQADLEKAKEAAEAADRAKSAFLANMSHEIRTPMNAILGYSQLMLRDPSLGGDAKKNLNIINRSGEHLLGLINDILVMSKIEAGRMELNPVTFDLATLVTDLAAMFRLRAEAKGLQLEVRLDGEAERRIVADQGKIREVLINLLGNAVKFTEAGWIKLRASLARRPDDQIGLSIQVEDTGVGISRSGTIQALPAIRANAKRRGIANRNRPGAGDQQGIRTADGRGDRGFERGGQGFHLPFRDPRTGGHRKPDFRRSRRLAACSGSLRTAGRSFADSRRPTARAGLAQRAAPVDRF